MRKNREDMQSNFIGKEISEAFMQNYGSIEHIQFGVLLSNAKKIVLDNKVANDIFYLYRNNINDVEKNMDLISIPENGIWIEWSNDITKTRNIGIGNLGCLFVKDPNQENKIVIITAWKDELGEFKHCYGISSIDLYDIYNHSYGARIKYSNNYFHSISRIMSYIFVTIPEGFKEEIEIFKNEKLVEGENTEEDFFLRDASLDVVYALTSLLILSIKNGFKYDNKEEYIYVQQDFKYKPNFFDLLKRKLYKNNTINYIKRKIKKDNPEGCWYIQQKT